MSKPQTRWPNPSQILVAQAFSSSVSLVIKLNVYMNTCREMTTRNVPDLFALGVPSDDPVDDGGFASFGVRVLLSDGVYLDIFGVVDIYKFLVDIRTVRPRMI